MLRIVVRIIVKEVSAAFVLIIVFLCLCCIEFQLSTSNETLICIKSFQGNQSQGSSSLGQWLIAESPLSAVLVN